MEDIELRRLVIKAFHMTDVKIGDENKITTDGKMTICKDGLDALAAKYSEVIEKIDIEVIDPGDHDRYTNTIMDIIPISVKVLGLTLTASRPTSSDPPRATSRTCSTSTEQAHLQTMTL